MAIAHVGTTTGTSASDASVITISSHTVSGTDPALILKVALRGTGDVVVDSAFWDVAGVNEQFTELNKDQNGEAGAVLLFLANPTAKTADVTINLNDTSRSVAAASTYSDVDQTNPFRVAAAASNNGTNDNPTVNVVALNSEMVVDSLCQVSAGPDTAIGDHTERHDTASIGGGTDTRGASQEVASAGATETMAWDMSGSDNWAICAGPLQEEVPDVSSSSSSSISSASSVSSVSSSSSSSNKGIPPMFNTRRPLVIWTKRINV